MMFKNLTLFRAGVALPQSAADLEQHLQAARFVTTGPTQPRSCGWIAPRGEEHGALVEAIDGHWIAALKIERRKVPGEVLTRRVDELAAEIEKNTGRKPGKKLRRELKDQAMLALLPQAFTTQTVVRLWIDLESRLIGLDTSSSARADEVITALVQSVSDPLNIDAIITNTSPGSAMSGWLLDGDAPGNFSLDREGELHGQDGDKPVVRYVRHSLDTDEVRDHVRQGQRAVRLALTWASRVAFVLTDGMTLRRIQILDVDVEDGPSPADGFDADVAIFTGEMSRLLDELIDALGGLQVLPIIAAAQGDVPPDASAAPAEVDDDPLYAEACKVVRSTGTPSISFVQRHLRIGYNRAARLLERMESDKLVSAMDHRGQRTVLAADDVATSARAAA